MENERYAVVFCERGGPSVAGALELQDGELVLSGGSGEERTDLEIALAEVVDVHVGRRPDERINGHATLVLARDHQLAVHIAPLGAGLLHEIADLLSALTHQRSRAADELAIIVPLRPGCLNRARELLHRGPPLDPASLGLTSHEVYLDHDKAIFVFRGPSVRARVEKAIRTPALWRAGLAWRSCIAGQPRIATKTPPHPASPPVYDWSRPAH